MDPDAVIAQRSVCKVWTLKKNSFARNPLMAPETAAIVLSENKDVIS